MKIINQSRIKCTYLKEFGRCIKDYLFAEGIVDDSTLVIVDIKSTGVFIHFTCSLCVEGKRYYHFTSVYDTIFNDVNMGKIEFVGEQQWFD